MESAWPWRERRSSKFCWLELAAGYPIVLFVVGCGCVKRGRAAFEGWPTPNVVSSWYADLGDEGADMKQINTPPRSRHPRFSLSLSLYAKPQDVGKCLRKKITRDYSRIIIHNRSNIHNIHNRSLECLHNLDLCQIAAVKLRRDPVNGHLKMGCRNLQRYSQLQTSEQTLFFSLASSVQWVLCETQKIDKNKIRR